MTTSGPTPPMLIAVTPAVSPTLADCELTLRPRDPINVADAMAEHAFYEETLRSLGATVVHAPAEPTLPDAVFVEDTAVVLDEVAVMTGPGADTRPRHNRDFVENHRRILHEDGVRQRRFRRRVDNRGTERAECFLIERVLRHRVCDVDRVARTKCQLAVRQCGTDGTGYRDEHGRCRITRGHARMPQLVHQLHLTPTEDRDDLARDPLPARV